MGLPVGEGVGCVCLDVPPLPQTARRGGPQRDMLSAVLVQDSCTRFGELADMGKLKETVP